MRYRSSLLCASAGLVAVIGIFACGKPQTSPSGPATPYRLTISGPSSVAPNQTAAFTATEYFRDGTAISSQDATALAHWVSQSPDVLTVTATGQATGLRIGQTSLVASVIGLFATVNVLVLPSGTFRLAGTVTESTVPVTNVTVTVTSGTGAGLTSQTENGGGYLLYGVAGDIQIRATRVGFNDATVNTTVNANAIQDISLTPVMPEPNISGTYAMTLDADPSCQLPAGEMERQYTATITQTGLQVKVVLSGATFVFSNPGGTGVGNSFPGQVTGGQFSYAVNSNGYYYAAAWSDVVESIANGEIFVPIGSGVLVPSGPNLTGTLSGTLYVGTPPPWSKNWVIAQCFSNNHRVLLTAQTSAAHRVRR